MQQSVPNSNKTGNDQTLNRWIPCKLLSWRKEEVAYGSAYVGNEPQTIHFKTLPESSYKVKIDGIGNGEIELPEPDGFHSTLGEIGIGSYVAWPIHFIKFTS